MVVRTGHLRDISDMVAAVPDGLMATHQFGGLLSAEILYCICMYVCT
jgi:hypothetical protein